MYRALLWQVLPVLTSALAIAVRAAGTGAVAQVLRAAGRLLECALQLLPRLDDGESCLAVLLEPLQVLVLTGGYPFVTLSRFHLLPGRRHDRLC